MSKKGFLILVIAVLLIAYLGWLGYLGLRAEEPRRAIISVEMMMNGDYLMPHLTGWPYYNKPPLFNWIMIPFFKLLGSFSEWVVRLPSTLSLLLLAFLNWRLIRKHVHPEVALLSSLFLLASADILFYGSVNTGEIDLFYAFLVYLNIIVIYLFLERKKYLWLFVLSYFLAALGFLTKGLPSIPFQGFTLVAGLIYFRAFRMFFSWKHLLGILVFVALAGGYMLLLDQRGEMNGFLIRQVKESSQRTGIESNLFSTIRGLLENPVVFIKISLPWTLALLGFFSKTIRRKVMANRLVGYSLLVVAVNFPLYWITGELRARYIYPIIPFLCIVCAMLVYEGYANHRAFRIVIDKGLLYLFILFSLAMGAAFFIPGLQVDTIDVIIISLLILGGIAMFYYYKRDQAIRILAIVLLMAMARIGMNITYLQLYKETSQTTILKGHVAAMLDIAGEKEINMTGTPYVYNSTITLMGREYLEGDVVVPLILSYQVPYYYALYTNRTIGMVEDPIPGNLYLIIDHDLDKYPGEVLYTYLDMSTQHDWNLVKLASE